MTARRFGLLVLVFAVGYGVATMIAPRPRDPDPAALGMIRVIRCANPADGLAEYTPFRVVTDGRAVDLADAPRGGAEVWRLEMAEGRVVVFATRRSLPVQGGP